HEESTDLCKTLEPRCGEWFLPNISGKWLLPNVKGIGDKSGPGSYRMSQYLQDRLWRLIQVGDADRKTERAKTVFDGIWNNCSIKCEPAHPDQHNPPPRSAQSALSHG